MSGISNPNNTNNPHTSKIKYSKIDGELPDEYKYESNDFKEQNNNSQNHRSIKEQIENVISNIDNNPAQSVSIVNETYENLADAYKIFNYESTDYELKIISSIDQAITIVDNKINFKKLDKMLLKNGIMLFNQNNGDCILTVVDHNTHKLTSASGITIENLHGQICFSNKIRHPTPLPYHSRIAVTLLPTTPEQMTVILDVMYSSLKKFKELNYFKIVDIALEEFFTRRDQFVMYVDTIDQKRIREIATYLHMMIARTHIDYFNYKMTQELHLHPASWSSSFEKSFMNLMFSKSSFGIYSK